VDGLKNKVGDGKTGDLGEEIYQFFVSSSDLTSHLMLVVAALADPKPFLENMGTLQ